MHSFAVALIAVAVLGLMSAFANARLRRFSDLPMQFGLDGQPTWSASRWIALSATPILAGVILFPLAAMGLAAVAHGMRAMLLLVGVFIAVHTFHLRLLWRWARR